LIRHVDVKPFTYDLPRSSIASYPSEDRNEARLMAVDRSSGEISHSSFSSLGDFLRRGDVLVMNDSRVIPARLLGKKESGGKVEVLLVEPFPKWNSLWTALVNSSKAPRVGSRLLFDAGLYAQVIGDMGGGRYGLKFCHTGDFMELLAEIGETPLPLYIQRGRRPVSLDKERYQTIYARHDGSIAAPTAGFHFTPAQLDDLAAKDVERLFVTLHVGPGTFQPVRPKNIEQHRMEGERYRLTEAAAAGIMEAKREGRRVIAVGTTTTRALEWVAERRGSVKADEGIARLFIYPGHKFRVIDGLVTNFHLPDSTPLSLVAAFTGLELLEKAYLEAIRLRYRFYSYGDAMLII
jgi:S-adenosylmethionine:tRNA ribosyltransferase-isomerase